MLINDKEEISLCDFGLASIIDGFRSGHTTLGIGTTRYMAPELFDEQRRSTASDVWAFGLVALEVRTYRFLTILIQVLLS